MVTTPLSSYLDCIIFYDHSTVYIGQQLTCDRAMIDVTVSMGTKSVVPA